MTDTRLLVDAIPEPQLREFVLRQRWFGAKARNVSELRVASATPIRELASPLFVLAVLEVYFDDGKHDLYQLLLGFREAAEDWTVGTIADVNGWVAYDAMADPMFAQEIVHLTRADETVDSGAGAIAFRSLATERGELTTGHGFRPMGAEQSNSSVVLDEHLVFKVYRRLQPGVNPELELLRFLTERAFGGIAAITGWASLVGGPVDTTLAIFQRYVRGVGDGWTLALDSLAGDPEPFLDQIAQLGTVTGAMHSVLASETAEETFAPLDPSPEALGILVAWVDELIEQVFADLPDLPALEPIAGRGGDVREQLRFLAQLGNTGRAIRGHGDYHLGQAIWTGTDWILLDFEGEPARTISERRRKRSPLRDVAGMLRSFAYAVRVFEIERGVPAPADWEQRARSAFLDAYFAEIDITLLPVTEEAQLKLLAIFELEKAVYELRYELNNRPDWVSIPVEGILRLLAHPQ